MKTQSLIYIVCVTALFCLGVVPTTDPDLGWHLKAGEWVASLGIPFTDPFSYTVRGQPWVAHEWLSELFMFRIYDFFAEPGLILFFAGLGAVSLLFVYAACNPRTYISLLLAVLGFAVLRAVWGARPQMFNVLLLAFFLFLIEAVRRGRWSSRVFYGLSLALILWQNLHGGFLLGLVVMMVYWAGEAWDARFRPAIQSDGLAYVARRRLLLAVALGIALCGMNPQGYRLLTYPFETLGSHYQQNFITEWLSPNFHNPIFYPYLVYMVLAIGSFFVQKRPPRTAHLLLFLGSFAAGLLSGRHIPFFVIVSIPMVSRNLNGLLSPDYFASGATSRLKKTANLVLAGLFLATAVSWTHSVIEGNAARIKKEYPVAAVDFLKRNDAPQGNLFHLAHWGGYLISREVPVFIDGRPDLHGDDFCLQYIGMIELRKDWQEWVRLFDFQYTLFPANHIFNRFLERQEEWALIYRDEVAEIYGKKDKVTSSR